MLYDSNRFEAYQDGKLNGTNLRALYIMNCVLSIYVYMQYIYIYILHLFQDWVRHHALPRSGIETTLG